MYNSSGFHNKRLVEYNDLPTAFSTTGAPSRPASASNHSPRLPFSPCSGAGKLATVRRMLRGLFPQFLHLEPHIFQLQIPSSCLHVQKASSFSKLGFVVVLDLVELLLVIVLKQKSSKKSRVLCPIQVRKNKCILTIINHTTS